jgi:hypothetical protein
MISASSLPKPPLEVQLCLGSGHCQPSIPTPIQVFGTRGSLAINRSMVVLYSFLIFDAFCCAICSLYSAPLLKRKVGSTPLSPSASLKLIYLQAYHDRIFDTIDSLRILKTRKKGEKHA